MGALSCATDVGDSLLLCAPDGCDGYCSLHAAGLGKSLSRPAAGTKDDADASEPAAANHQTRDGTMDEKTSFSRKKTNVHRRMKKLTNPMALHHRTAAAAPTWSEVYDDLDRPLLIDVGCAKGRFLMRAANADAARFEALRAEGAAIDAKRSFRPGYRPRHDAERIDEAVQRGARGCCSSRTRSTVYR